MNDLTDAALLTRDRQSVTQIYQQVRDQLQTLAASGSIGPGTAVPSVRAMATLHAIDTDTVS